MTHVLKYWNQGKNLVSVMCFYFLVGRLYPSLIDRMTKLHHYMTQASSPQNLSFSL